MMIAPQSNRDRGISPSAFACRLGFRGRVRALLSCCLAVAICHAGNAAGQPSVPPAIAPISGPDALNVAAASRAAGDGALERRWRFASTALAAGDDFRAVGYFREISVLAGNEHERFRALCLMGLALHRARQFRAAIAAYDVIAGSDTVDESLRLRSSLLSAVALGDGGLQGRDGTRVLTALGRLRDICVGSAGEVCQIATFHRARFVAASGETGRARSLVSAMLVSKDSVNPVLRSQMEDLVSRSQRPVPTQKWPALAGVLAVAPGLGAVYAEHYFDGLYYAGLILGGAALTWSAYRPELELAQQPAAMWSLGTLSLLLYGASVVQAVNMTSRLNVARQVEYASQVATGYDLIASSGIGSVGPQKLGQDAAGHQTKAHQ